MEKGTAQNSRKRQLGGDESIHSALIDEDKTAGTKPQDAIEEVEFSDDFKRLYEESLKNIQEGNVIRGEVVEIGRDYIAVDIGYKSEGRVDPSEFMDEKGNLTVKVGDQVEVLLVRKEGDENDRPIISRERASEAKLWNHLKELFEKGGTVSGKIVEKVKGGFSVDIGVRAFLPGSQVDVRPVQDPDGVIGLEDRFKIIRISRKQRNVVVSRREVLEEEQLAARREILDKMKEGDLVDGKVVHIVPYGLFVDVGGVSGLVRISDISWGRVGDPSERYRVGDEIQAVVLKISQEKGRILLGIKQLKPDPWLDVQQRYSIGSRVTGRVMEIKEYGAFVELEEGVEGLVHVSNMSWTRKVQHPSEILNAGETVEVLVLEVDPAKRQVSLGIKQAELNPWDAVAERYPVGTVIEGKIKRVKKFGIFIGIYEGIEGLVHVSNLSWTRKVQHPSELYSKGQTVRAVVLDIDREKEVVSLGIKQLTPDPWERIPDRYRPGAPVSGTVTGVADFGVFAEIEEGVEALIPASELPAEERKDMQAHYPVGTSIEADVLSVSAEEKKIWLSVRRREEKARKKKKESISTLGEMMEQKERR